MLFDLLSLLLVAHLILWSDVFGRVSGVEVDVEGVLHSCCLFLYTPSDVSFSTLFSNF